MKRSLIALSVAAAVLAPAAEAAPKVYGKLNLSTENFTDSLAPATSTSRLVSNASRFGVKGEDELTAELSAIYQIEWQVAADSAEANATTGTPATRTNNFDLTARNRFVGLKHASYGAIKAGQFDSYLKLAEGENDLFNDLYGDMQLVVAGQNRLKNVIGYESPKFEGLGFNLQYQTNDSSNLNASSAPGVKGGKSASLVYNNEELGLYAALAADRGVSSKGAVYTATTAAPTPTTNLYAGNGAGSTEGQRNNNRAVIGYKVGGLFVGAVYTTSELTSEAVSSLTLPVPGSKQREKGYSLSSAYKLDDHTFKLQYGKGDAKDNEASVRTVSAGYDYNFTSKTKAFGYYTKLDAKNAAGANYGDQRVFGVGLEHKF